MGWKHWKLWTLLTNFPPKSRHNGQERPQWTQWTIPPLIKSQLLLCSWENALHTSFPGAYRVHMVYKQYTGYTLYTLFTSLFPSEIPSSLWMDHIAVDF